MTLVVTIANHSNFTVILSKALAEHCWKTPGAKKGSAKNCPSAGLQKKTAGEHLFSGGSEVNRVAGVSVGSLRALDVTLWHPWHHATEIFARFLNLMFFVGLEQGVVLLVATLVFLDPCPGELA